MDKNDSNTGVLEKTVKHAKDLGFREIAKDVYEDGLQGTVQELGCSLTTVAKTINVAISPLKGLVWSFEKIENYITKSLQNRFAYTNPNKIKKPRISLACMTVEALRFTEEEDVLREVFANLLASSMYSNTQEIVHPSFIEIIKQITPDEARVLLLISKENKFHLISERLEFPNKYPKEGEKPYSALQDEFKNYILNKNDNIINGSVILEHPDLIEAYLINLIRLQLISPIKESLTLDSKPRSGRFHSVTQTYEALMLTQFGENFIGSCITPEYGDVDTIESS